MKPSGNSKILSLFILFFIRKNNSIYISIYFIFETFKNKKKTSISFDKNV